MSFKHLFKEKYESILACEFIEKIIRKMSDLKRENYYDQQKIESRNAEIKSIEQTLTELNIPIENIVEVDEEEEYE